SAISYRDAVHTGIMRHEHIVGGIPHHDDRALFDTELRHDVVQHSGVGLAQSLVRTACHVEIFQHAVRVEHPIKPQAALAGSYCQQNALLFQIVQQLTHTVEQRDIAVKLHEV